MSYRSRLDKKKSRLKLKWAFTLGIGFILFGIYLFLDFDDNNSSNKTKSDQSETIVKKEIKIPESEQNNTKDLENDDSSPEVAVPDKKENAYLSEENVEAKNYPEATASIYNITEYMNAIYVEADELQKKFTPYDENNSFSYIGTTDLNNLYKYNLEISNEVTASSHFLQPNYTVPGFRQTVESNRIIVRELNELNLLVEQYPRKFQEDPEGTLNQAESNLERIKIASQSKLPGFEKLFESADKLRN